MTVYSGAVLSGAGSTLVLSSGDTAYDTQVLDGALATVRSGGVASGSTLVSGILYVSSGGESYNTIVSSGGQESVYPGGFSYGSVVSNGGQQEVRSGGLASGTTLFGVSSQNIQSGGVASATTLNSGGVQYVSSGAMSYDNVISSGGVESVLSGGVTSNVTIDNGGSLKVYNGTANDVTISSGGTLYVSSGTATDVGLKSGGIIDIQSIPYSANPTYEYDASTHVLTVMGGGKTQSITLDPDNSDVVDGQQFVFVRDSDGSTLIETCFLAGSMIQTPAGLVAVETLRIGDEVSVFEQGVERSRKIVWAGTKKAVVQPALSDDEAGWPVRVMKDAIAPGVPFKDMLITAEHCLFFDEKFIPVRMLVNGRSIFYDKTIFSYEYYHVETEEHSILMADGVLTESYLDTGNRHAYRQMGTLVTIAGRQKTWKENAAAPLGTAQAFVEPVFNRIELRARQEGIGHAGTAPVLTEDTDLHLVANTGAVIRGTRNVDGLAIFKVPAGVESVRIVSRVSRPSDIVGPFVDDRRRLGVAIGEISMVEGGVSAPIRLHLTENRLEGWHAFEGGEARWTAGDALLHLGERHPRSTALLAIQIKAGGPYQMSENHDLALAAVG